MAQYDITYRCGHEATVQIYGTNTHGERERKAAWWIDHRLSSHTALRAAGQAVNKQEA